jgi:hypothetical protein
MAKNLVPHNLLRSFGAGFDVSGGAGGPTLCLHYEQFALAGDD